MYHRDLTYRKRRIAVLGAVLVVLTAQSAYAALTQEQKCQSAVIKFSRLYEDKRINAINKCEQDKLKGKLPFTTVCPDTVADDKIAKALALLQKQIANNCCGKDKACGAGTGEDADLALSAIGWDAFTGLRCDGGDNDAEPCTNDANCIGGGTCVSQTVCPSIESSTACDFAVRGYQDVDDCLTCIGDLATDQSLDISYGDLKAPGANKPVELCKREMNKVTLFYRKVRSFRRLCQDKVAKGSIPGPCPDSATQTKLDAEEAKLLSALAKKCGGADKAFGGGDDLLVEATGGPISCPAVTVPGGSACGEQIATMQDYAECLLCVNDYKVACADAVAAPGANPAECSPTCGNGKIDGGETCDDGNLVDGDACPATCVIASCTPSGGQVTVNVNYTAPEPIAGVVFYIDYDESEVRIPGTGSQQQVQDRIFLQTGTLNGFFTPNDLNYALQVVQFDAEGEAFTGSTLAQIELDTCTGAAVADDDFTCRVLSASSDGTPVDVVGATCTVDVP